MSKRNFTMPRLNKGILPPFSDLMNEAADRLCATAGCPPDAECSDCPFASGTDLRAFVNQCSDANDS